MIQNHIQKRHRKQAVWENKTLSVCEHRLPPINHGNFCKCNHSYMRLVHAGCAFWKHMTTAGSVINVGTILVGLLPFRWLAIPLPLATAALAQQPPFVQVAATRWALIEPCRLSVQFCYSEISTCYTCTPLWPGKEGTVAWFTLLLSEQSFLEPVMHQCGLTKVLISYMHVYIMNILFSQDLFYYINVFLYI